MTRYAGPIRFRGNTPSARQYESAGRKLLGELEERAKYGAAVSKLHRTLSDGTVLTAWRAGSQHLLDVRVPPRVVAGEERAEVLVFDGIATRPTLTEQATFGGSYYGTLGYENDGSQLNMAVTRPRRGGAFTASWYSAEWIPDDVPPRFFGHVFTAGLMHTANLDWQGKAGVVQFFGPMNRISDPSQYFSWEVFRNGELLLDMWEIELALFGDRGWFVYGAALHGIGVACELRLIVGDYRGGTTFRYHALRIPLVSASTDPALAGVPLHLHPRLTVPRDEFDEVTGYELLGSYDYTNHSGYVAPIFFNQSGTEARGILAGNHPTLDYKLQELVVGFVEGDDGLVANFALTDLPTPERTVSTEVETLGAVSMATGDLYNSVDALPFPARTSVAGGAVPSYAASTTYTANETSSVEWAKIAVDYRDDVPVYLELKRRTGGSTRTVTFGRSGDEGTGNVLWSSLTSDWGAADGAGATGAVDWETVEARDDAYSESWRTDWWTGVDTDTLESDASGAFSGAVAGTNDGTLTGTSSRSITVASVRHHLLFCDLRHKVIAYQRIEDVDTTIDSRVHDYGLAGSLPVGEVTIDGSQTVTHKLRMVVNADGVEVENTLVTDDATVTSLDGTDPFTNPTAKFAYSLFLLQVPNGVATDGYSASSSAVDTEATPPQVDVFAVDKREDYAYDTAVSSWNIGNWVVSRNLLAYSYPITEGQTDSAPGSDTAAKFKHGLFNRSSGAAFDTTLTALAGESPFVRFHPIYVLSPFAAKRRI